MDSLWIPYGFPMNFLWFSFGFSMDSLWIPYGFLLDSLWIPHGFPKDFPWIPYEFPMGFPMDFLWIPYGFPMGCLWISVISEISPPCRLDLILSAWRLQCACTVDLVLSPWRLAYIVAHGRLPCIISLWRSPLFMEPNLAIFSPQGHWPTFSVQQTIFEYLSRGTSQHSLTD